MPLASPFNRTPEARAGGRTYLVYTLAAGQVLLLAIVWTQTLAPGGEFRLGTVNFGLCTNSCSLKRCRQFQQFVGRVITNLRIG